VNIHTARACDELKAVARKRDIGNRVGPRETHGRAFLARSETALNASGDRAERRYLAGCEADAVSADLKNYAAFNWSILDSEFPHLGFHW